MQNDDHDKTCYVFTFIDKGKLLSVRVCFHII